MQTNSARPPPASLPPLPPELATKISAYAQQSLEDEGKASKRREVNVVVSQPTAAYREFTASIEFPRDIIERFLPAANLDVSLSFKRDVMRYLYYHQTKEYQKRAAAASKIAFMTSLTAPEVNVVVESLPYLPPMEILQLRNSFCTAMACGLVSAFVNLILGRSVCEASTNTISTPRFSTGESAFHTRIRTRIRTRLTHSIAPIMLLQKL